VSLYKRFDPLQGGAPRAAHTGEPILDHAPVDTQEPGDAAGRVALLLNAFLQGSKNNVLSIIEFTHGTSSESEYGISLGARADAANPDKGSLFLGPWEFGVSSAQFIRVVRRIFARMFPAVLRGTSGRRKVFASKG
jgi:hypothetical protein